MDTIYGISTKTKQMPTGQEGQVSVSEMLLREEINKLEENTEKIKQLKEHVRDKKK